MASKDFAEDRDKPSLIFMHHPPTITGTKIFDQIIYKTSLKFNELIAKKKNLLGILSAHYHPLCITTFEEKLCFMAPSAASVHYFAHCQDEHVTA